MFVLLDFYIRLMGFLGRHDIDLRNSPVSVPEAYRNNSARAVAAEADVRMSRLKDKIDTGAFEQGTLSTDMSQPEDFPQITTCAGFESLRMQNVD